MRSRSDRGRPAPAPPFSRLLPPAALLIGLLAAVTPAAAGAGPVRDHSADFPQKLVRSATSETATWIVAAKAGPRADLIARRHGALESNEVEGLYSVPSGALEPFVRSLRLAGLLRYAEPDVAVDQRAYPGDDLAGDQWWLDAIVDTETAEPPTVSQGSPRLAIVAPGIYRNHPDLTKIDLKGANSRGIAQDGYGTAAAGIAASPGEGSGIRGVWPGMKLRHAPSGDGTCLEASEAVRRAARLGSKVIVMGYGFRPDQCRTHLAATQYAVYRGAVLVAGSDYGREGDALLRPAADPHVLTVGSVDQALTLAPFSATGPQVDLVAPGSSILAPSLGPSKSATPAFGHATVSGTGYSATMVGATAAWVTQARRAEPSQVMAVLAAGATDLGDPGRDEVFGSGLVQVEGALSARSPIADKMEPNDDIGWVDGRLLTGGRSPIVMKPLWSPGGKRTRKLQATLSEDDPSDVYRIRMPARSQVLIAVAQAEGDVAIEVRSAASKTIRQKKGILSASDEKPQPGTEGTLVRNRARGFRPVYLVVRPGNDSSSGVARYQVTVTGSPLG